MKAPATYQEVQAIRRQVNQAHGDEYDRLSANAALYWGFKTPTSIRGRIHCYHFQEEDVTICEFAKRARAVVTIGKSPNGKFTNSIDVTYSEGGYCGPCSIWGEEYSSRDQALAGGIEHVVDHLDRTIKWYNNRSANKVAELKKMRRQTLKFPVNAYQLDFLELL